MKTSNSTLIKGYDYDSGTLTILFVSGRIYEYYKVSPSLFEEFEAAESHGKFFNSEIKPHHPCKELTSR